MRTWLTGDMMDRQAQEASWWQTWRQFDLSWEGLARRPGSDGGSLQDYWRNESARLIAEPGAHRLWTRFHCPIVFADGTPSPKAAWTVEEWNDLHATLRTRLAMGTAERPCLLTGVVLDGLFEAETEVPEVDGFLWLRADLAYFRDGIDLSRNGLGLADFRGAWFGGKAVLEGTQALTADFSGAYHAARMIEAPQQTVSPPLTQRRRTPVLPTPSLPDDPEPSRLPTPVAFTGFEPKGLAGRLLAGSAVLSVLTSILWLIAHQP